MVFGKFGFADLYLPSTKEVWEVKPNKQKYIEIGKEQLAKYIFNISGSKRGRKLGEFLIYYFDGTGIYTINIYSHFDDGMIYYEYKYDVGKSLAVLGVALDIALILTGVGAPEGAGTLAYSFSKLAPALIP